MVAPPERDANEGKTGVERRERRERRPLDWHFPPHVGCYYPGRGM